jgi:pimeloyl-ACP methyl ester carboxylesterase
MGSFSANWHWVQRDLDATLRVVAYDRAGLGWSDPSPRPRDARTIAEELHEALHAAGVSGPYVLAGHSFGGLPVRAFAALYPEETAGLVLVDASHPDQWERWPVRRADRMIAISQRVCAALATIGLLRIVDLSASISAGLPPRQVAELRARSALPRVALTEAAQMDAWPTSRSQLHTDGDLGDLPIIVIGVTEQPRGGDVLSELQAELVTLSTNCVRTIVQDASHESLVADRVHSRAVTEAIQMVAAAGTATRVLSELDSGHPR